MHYAFICKLDVEEQIRFGLYSELFLLGDVFKSSLSYSVRD